MNHAFRNPATAQAAKELTEFNRTSLDPVKVFDCFSNAFLMPNPTAIALVDAMQ